LFRFHYVGYESQYPIGLSGLVLFKTNTEFSSMNSILQNITKKYFVIYLSKFKLKSKSKKKKIMKDIDEGTIRRIDWLEFMPPVLLFRVFNTAVGGRVLFFAVVGILLTIFVNLFLYTFNSPQVRRFEELTGKSIEREKGLSIIIDRVNKDRVNKRSVQLQEGKLLNLVEFIADEFQDSVLFAWNFFTRSGRQFFMVNHGSWLKFGINFLGFTAIVIVWGVAGGLICRSAAMRLTQDKTESISDLFRFLKNRGIGFLSSVLILTIGILFCILIGMIPIQVANSCNVTVIDYFVTIIFPFVFLFNFLAFFLLVGLWFGFPLLFAAVAAEGADGFDAVSRMFSYLFQRPFHYVLYWFLAAVQGFLGYFAVMFFVTGTIALTEYFMGLDRGLSLFVNISSSAGSSDISGISKFCVLKNPILLILISAWFDLLRFIVIAYIFAWFWTSGVAIYLLLRRSVDAAPFTEIYYQDPVKVRVLPKIQKDNQGVPEINAENHEK
jgi:hypothetical protein